MRRTYAQRREAEIAHDLARITRCPACGSWTWARRPGAPCTHLTPRRHEERDAA